MSILLIPVVSRLVFALRMSEPPSTIVLLVEDDAALAEAIRWTLSMAGLLVSVYGCAEEALSGFDPSRPFCLVTDLHLPGLDGLELSDSIVERVGAPVPTLLITARDGSSVRAAVAARPHVRLAEKPIAPERILEWLAECCRPQ